MTPDPTEPGLGSAANLAKNRRLAESSALPRWIQTTCSKHPNKFRTAFILINADQSLHHLNRTDRRSLARLARTKGNK